MTRPVVWSANALDDLGNLLEYLAEDDPDFSFWLIDQIEAAGDRLGEHPTGRPGRVNGIFEKSLPHLRYIIAYSLDRSSPRGEVRILRVIHSARHWPKGSWPE